MKCIVKRLVDQTPEPYKTALLSLLANDAYTGGLSADVVAKTMREAGLRTSATAIRLHRASTCICS